MLDVKEWYHVVKQMNHHMSSGDVWQFVMNFSVDEIAAAEEFLTKLHGWCPPIYTMYSFPGDSLPGWLSNQGGICDV